MGRMDQGAGGPEDKPVVHPAHPPSVSETQREEGLVQLVASAPPSWEERGRGGAGRAVRGRHKNEGRPGFWGRRNERGQKETEPQKDLGNLGSTGNRAPARQTVPSARGRQGMTGEGRQRTAGAGRVPWAHRRGVLWAGGCPVPVWGSPGSRTLWAFLGGCAVGACRGVRAGGQSPAAGQL